MEYSRSYTYKRKRNEEEKRKEKEQEAHCSKTVLSCLSLLFSSFSSLPLFLMSVLSVGIVVAGLYGVFKEKPDFLLGYLVSQILSLIAIIAMMVMVLLFSSFLIAVVSGDSTVPREKTKDLVSASFGVVLLWELMLGAFAGLQYYFFVVVYSFYAKMKTGSQFPLGNRV